MPLLKKKSKPIVDAAATEGATEKPVAAVKPEKEAKKRTSMFGKAKKVKEASSSPEAADKPRQGSVVDADAEDSDSDKETGQVHTHAAHPKAAPAAAPAAAPEQKVNAEKALAKLEQQEAAASSAVAAATAAPGGEAAKLRAENEALRGQVHLLNFKVELLLGMVTLANLDCDKLEADLEAVQVN